ncbi:uncharacterized protein LOC130273348 [Hyla sarda]|uniref:uncharacterized protein LOC130273348 n=1 Tax=Hyla sarda TaxID=327740 RepID=UPI0024C3CABD|nr:uncharacterized protein LOC130273348 [Hyla sarda]
MASMLENAVQCTSCSMYAILEQQFEGAYCCARCVLVVRLEAQILHLEGRLATMRSINNMERSLLLTEQALSGIEVGEDSGTELQDSQAVSWVTVRKRGRGKSVREASPELAHPNKFARLADEGDAITELAELQQDTASDRQGGVCSSKEGGRSTGQARQVLVVGDSIIRGTDRAICHKDRDRRTVCCLPGARVRHIADRVDRLLGGAGEDPAVMVHIGTNDKVRGRWSVLKNDFRDLGRKLKARTSKVVFSEILPVPRATPERQREIREVNKWLRSWCRKEGFGFMENWADFAVGYRLYRRDGLHLNGEGAALLGEKMARRVEECLN